MSKAGAKPPNLFPVNEMSLLAAPDCDAKRRPFGHGLSLRPVPARGAGGAKDAERFVAPGNDGVASGVALATKERKND